MIRWKFCYIGVRSGVMATTNTPTESGSPSEIGQKDITAMFAELTSSISTKFDQLNDRISTSMDEMRSEVKEFSTELERVKNEVNYLKNMRDFSAALNALQFSEGPVVQSSPNASRADAPTPLPNGGTFGEPSSRVASAAQGLASPTNGSLASQEIVNSGVTRVINNVSSVDSGLKVKLTPEVFDGTKRWVDYLLTFELTADINNWDDSLKAKYLAAMLRGPALEVLRSLSPMERASYIHLKAALDKRFGETFHRAMHHAQPRSRQQQKGEDFVSFADDIRRLVASAYHDCSAVAQDKIAMNHFLDGDTVVQDLVRFGLPDTLDKAVQLALQYHHSRSATRSNHKPVRLLHETDAQNTTSDSDNTSLYEENVYGLRTAGTQTNSRRRNKFHNKRNSGNERSPA